MIKCRVVGDAIVIVARDIVFASRMGLVNAS